MGIPIEKDWMDVILKLSKDDKIELIAAISNSMTSKDILVTTRSSGDVAWDAGVKKVSDLSHDEWLANLNSLAGAWSDMPDDIAEQIISARFIPDREINLDD